MATQRVGDLEPGSRFPASTLRTYATLPRARAVVPASDLAPDLPARAVQFCPPVAGPYGTGALCFSPVGFSFRVRSDAVDFRLPGDDGSTYLRTIDEDSYIRISDFSPSWHQECVDLYRDRLAGQRVPKHFDVDDPDYPHHFIEVTHEQGPRDFGFLISIWLGVVFETEPGHELFVKDPSHVQMVDRGFRVLDAVIASDRWHGSVAIPLRVHNKDAWLSVAPEEPLAQVWVFRPAGDVVEHTDIPSVPEGRILDPLRWHVFDPYRRNAVRLGKYQSDLRDGGSWDRDWERSEQRFAERKASINSDSLLIFRRKPTLQQDGNLVRVSLSPEDEFESDDPRLRAFLIGLGSVAGPFRVAEALTWSRAEGETVPEEEILEHLQLLIRHGLLAAKRNV
ncbi:hypothetical protein [Microlunatus sp. GCM10028923]|uniref:hypothetical protein n=1 Tax=Microlunatus sp. GCM10028923 TaxID=3273400 RepID=UPI00360EE520